jgi:hypothetical protein
MGLLVGTLLTIAALGVIFMAAFIRLWKTPPVISVNLTLPLPERFVIQHQHVPATEEKAKSIEEPIPEDILNYILGESDAWAQEARKRKARELKRETGSWDVAFRLLQREDNPE